MGSNCGVGAVSVVYSMAQVWVGGEGEKGLPEMRCDDDDDGDGDVSAAGG